MIRAGAALLAALPALAPLRAAAEVCDKERPFWRPADGPVGALQDLIHSIATPLGAALLLCLLAPLVWRRAIPALLAANTALLAALFTWLERSSPSDPATAAALAEGCMGPPGAPVAALLLAALGLYWLGGTRLARRRRAALAALRQEQAEAEAARTQAMQPGEDDTSET